MLTKNIYLDTFFIWIIPFLFLILFFLNYIVYINYKLVGFLFSVFVLTLVAVFFLFLANYESCRISYDGEYITRRGLFCGFKLKIHKKEIIKVSKIKIGRNEYYELVDGVHFSYGSFNKNTSIKIPYTEEGKKFIKQFWENEIATQKYAC